MILDRENCAYDKHQAVNQHENETSDENKLMNVTTNRRLQDSNVLVMK